MAKSTERTEETRPLNIHERILEARQRVTGFIEKDGKVTSGNKTLYDYISHDAVTAHIRQVFNDLGIAVWPTVLDRMDNNNKVSLKVETDFVCADDPDSHRAIVTWGDGTDNSDKGCGIAESYAVKIAYLKVMLLNSADDQGGEIVPHDPVDPTASDAERAKAKARDDMIAMSNELKLAIAGCQSVRELRNLQKERRDWLMNDIPEVTKEYFMEAFQTREAELKDLETNPIGAG